MNTFCEILKMLRAEAGLSLKRVAESVGVSDAAVCKWETGTSEPKVCYLIKLSELFDCSVDYLVGKTDEHSDKGQAAKITATPLDPDERALIASYRNLNKEKRTLLRLTAAAWK